MAFTVGGALPMAGSLILMPIYITSYDPAQYGELTLLITLTMLFQSFISFGLDNFLGVQIHYDVNEPAKQRHLIANVFALQFLIGLAFTVFMLLFGNLVMSLFFGSGEVDFYYSGLWCVLTAFMACIYKTYQNLQINQQQVKPFLVQSVLFTFMNVGFSLAGMHLMPNDIDGPLVGRLVAGGLFFIGIWFFGLKVKRSEVDFKLDGWFKFSWPVLLMAMNAWIVSYSSPYILNHYVSKDQVGLYSFVLTLLIVLDFFHNGLTSSLLPTMFQNRVKAGKVPSEEKGVHHFYSMINVLSMGGTLLVLPILIPIIVHKAEFLEATKWMLLFAAGYAWKGVYFSSYSVVMYERNSRALMYNGIFSTWAQVIIIILLSSWIGLEGALLGTALGKLIQSYGLYFRSETAKRIELSKMKLHVLPSAYAGILLVLFYLPFTGSMVMKGFVAFLMSLVAIGLVYRNDIPQMFRLVKEKIGLK